MKSNHVDHTSRKLITSYGHSNFHPH